MLTDERKQELTFDKQMPLWKLGATLAHTEEKTDRTAIKRLMNTKRLHYRLGWIAATQMKELAVAERSYVIRHSESLVKDFLAGYDDRSHNRAFGHLQQCPEHAEGTCDPSKGLHDSEDFI